MTRMFLVLVVLLSVSACTTPITIPVPQGRFDVPETIGKKKIAVSFSVVRDAYNVTLTPDAGTVPVSSIAPQIAIEPEGGGTFSLFGGLRFDASYGLSPRFEVGTASWNSGVYVKYQFLGKSQLKARKGDVSLALVMKAQFPKNSAGSSGGFSYNLQGTGYDASVLGGYRVSDNSLFYAGVFKGNVRFSGSVYDSAGNSIESFDGYWDTAGYIAGLYVKPGDHFFFGFEWLSSSLDFTDTGGSANKQGNFYGWRAGYNF